MKSPTAFLTSLRKDRAAVAMTEFALAAPLMITLGIYGVETTNLAMTHMRISQVTMQIADNASRIGDTSTLQNRKIYEFDINDLFFGADIHAGQKTDIYEHGRVIISSLEERDGRQVIAWQRCKGKLNINSSYGVAGDGDVGKPTLSGMGPAGSIIRAPTGSAVNFVEVAYDYQPLITGRLIPERRITSVAAFIVRDDRDLSGIYQRDPTDADPVSNCTTFDSFAPVT